MCDGTFALKHVCAKEIGDVKNVERTYANQVWVEKEERPKKWTESGEKIQRVFIKFPAPIIVFVVHAHVLRKYCARVRANMFSSRLRCVPIGRTWCSMGVAWRLTSTVPLKIVNSVVAGHATRNQYNRSLALVSDVSAVAAGTSDSATIGSFSSAK